MLSTVLCWLWVMPYVCFMTVKKITKPQANSFAYVVHLYLRD